MKIQNYFLSFHWQTSHHIIFNHVRELSREKTCIRTLFCVSSFSKHSLIIILFFKFVKNLTIYGNLIFKSFNFSTIGNLLFNSTKMTFFCPPSFKKGFTIFRVKPFNYDCKFQIVLSLRSPLSL